jgi:hypothetical protein
MSQKSNSDWDLLFYILGGVLAIVILYYFFAHYTKNETMGSEKSKKIAMYIIASLTGLIILYLFVKHVYDSYTMTQRGEPWLVQTTKNANRMKVFSGRKILRSRDGRYGVEFSYSFWIYINEWTNTSRYKTGLHHILHKGSVTSIPDQCPGIWLKRDTNVMVLKMNTFHRNTDPECRADISNVSPTPPDTTVSEKCYLETCHIPNIPVGKWVHITISVINKNIDIYVNGFLKKRCLLKGLPKQNDGDVFMNAFGGFEGFMSRVRYYNYALPIWKIESIIKAGPSDAPCFDKGELPPYLASDYWTTLKYHNTGIN